MSNGTDIAPCRAKKLPIPNIAHLTCFMQDTGISTSEPEAKAEPEAEAEAEPDLFLAREF